MMTVIIGFVCDADGQDKAIRQTGRPESRAGRHLSENRVELVVDGTRS